MHARMRMRKGGPGRAIAGKAAARIKTGAAFVLLLFALIPIGCGNGPAATSGESGIEVSDPLLELAEDVMSYSPRTISAAADYLEMGIDHPQPPLPGELLSRLQRLEGQELRYVLMECLKSPSFGLDLCLTEIIRRGGDEWEGVLAAEVDRVYERQGILQDEIARLEAAGEQRLLRSSRWEREDLRGLMDGRLLTALRRVQGRPDPMVIFVSGQAYRDCSPGELPLFAARLTNVDSESLPLSFVPDCDARGERFGKWHVRIVDAKGAPVRRIISSCMGGLGSEKRFEFGESWARWIRVAGYVAVERPGIYTVTLYYHPNVYVSDYDFEELEGLILFKSVPIELTIDPVTVDLDDQTAHQIEESIAALPKESPVRIHGGDYTGAPGGFIAPDGPAGQLLTIGWPAVPTLIRRAADPETDRGRRAWMLATLYSITGFNGPERSLWGPLESLDVFGPFVYQHSGSPSVRYDWYGLAYEQTFPRGSFIAGRSNDSTEASRITSSADGPPMSQSMTLATAGRSSNIDPEKQLEFVRERWQPWLDNDWIVVKRE